MSTKISSPISPMLKWKTELFSTALPLSRHTATDISDREKGGSCCCPPMSIVAERQWRNSFVAIVSKTARIPLQQ